MLRWQFLPFVPRRLVLGLSVLAVALGLCDAAHVASTSRNAHAAQASTLNGAIDVPAASSAVSGVLEVQGWALDLADAESTGVSRIRVSLDGAFVTDAVVGDDRPDVAAAYGANFESAGWSATVDLPTLVTSGPHLLEVQVTSAVNGDTLRLTRPLQVSGDPRFCINTHVMWFSPAHAARDLDRARDIGVTSVRFDVRWDRLEPDQKGNFDQRYVAQVEDVVDMALARGVHPVIDFLGTPAWARANAGAIMTPPGNPADYGDAIGYLAKRLAPRQGLAYEIWNEPNHPEFWSGVPSDAFLYAQIVGHAHERIAAVAPGATIVAGAVVFNDPKYLDAFYAAGAGGAFDALSLHPYTLSTDPDPPTDPIRGFRTALAQAQAIMAAHGDSGKPIWITELGWKRSIVDDATRAVSLTQAVSFARSQPQVALFCAYELNQDDDSGGPDYGLLAPDGSPTLSLLAFEQAIVTPH